MVAARVAGIPKLAAVIVVLILDNIILSSYVYMYYGTNGADYIHELHLVENVTNHTTATGGRFAYAFCISGCTYSNDDGGSCLGYVLNILVASQILQQTQNNSAATKADIVVRVQMASGHARLAERQETWLASAGVEVQYNNDNGIDSFGLAALLKFQILEMTEYDRVMFLDADIIPKCSMNYMFDESYRQGGLLGKNVVVSGGVCPATASLFVVTPQKGEYERIVHLVHQYRLAHNGSLKFDKENGWGHTILPSNVSKHDRWEAYWMRKDGCVRTFLSSLIFLSRLVYLYNVSLYQPIFLSTAVYRYHWDYYGANVDQGLLYHWVRYMKLNYTQILIDRVQTWAEVTYDPAYSSNSSRNFGDIGVPLQDDDGGVRLLAKIREVDSSRLPTCTNHGAGRFRVRGYTTAPYSDHLHFGGPSKPWNNIIRAQDIPKNLPKNLLSLESQQGFWLYHLARANKTFQLGLDSTLQVTKGNPLGGRPKDQDLLDPNVELPKVGLR